MLASDSDPLLRLGIHRTSTYSSSPTSVIGADWETTEWGHPLGKDPKNQAEQVRQGSQVNRNTVRTVPCTPAGQYCQAMSE